MQRARSWIGSWALLLAVACGGIAAAADIISVAGTGKPELNDNTGIGVKVNVGDPFGVEIGPDRALYITEVRNHRVLRLDLETGRLATLAGNGTKGYSGDGGPAS